MAMVSFPVTLIWRAGDDRAFIYRTGDRVWRMRTISSGGKPSANPDVPRKEHPVRQ